MIATPTRPALPGTPAATPPWTLRTLKDQGPALPVGLVLPGTGGTRSRGFRIREFTTAREKRVAQIKQRAKGLTLGAFVAEALGELVQTLGPYNFDDPKMDTSAKRLAIGMMDVPDVLYLWVYMRQETMDGEPLRITMTCPACSGINPVDADLATLDVRVLPDSLVDLTRTHQLKKGITVKGAKRFVLQLATVKWHIFEGSAFSSADEATRDAAMIKASIIGVEGVETNGAPIIITDDEIDTLLKFDKEGLIQDIESNTPGPMMVVTADCIHCRSGMNQMIDWSYDNFFKRPARVIASVK